ncbi:TrbG/VirB9 family P-type conjugative transfer protein [Treponema zuelzerae]|uniref:TrbG/VirB9 family P-type conjugative transfer protein n=1 Tax=Teretinema zuelzerae TaxID=156 RepID=A0AAE3EFH3_9SPIR|nr:TrbG/VirB9 family P-type conjugative transfer protein [Teretinema zuelzerae]MCD1653522.1 TrbG/VirB9 family P-type conjugative transfer protein [Teretinema zuelzerae]
MYKRHEIRASFLLATSIVLVVSCKTMDMEPRNEVVKDKLVEMEEKSEEEVAVEELKTSIDVQNQIVYVDRPVYIPTPEPAVKRTTGLDSVKQSTEEGTIKPTEYSHAARIYDYDPDQVYEVYCQILRTTDIHLQPGEIVIDSPFVSDTERWIIGAGVNQQNNVVVQHIYVKPKQAGLDATLIINTNMRVYHVVLRSYSNVYMPIVKWKYHNQGMPQIFAKDITKEIQVATEMDTIDPRFLSFDYKITFNVFKKPRWIPTRVYDDGKKTYITFDEEVLQMELPGIFENKADVVNYRPQGNLIVIDKLIERVTVKYKKERITIEKKKG